MKRYLICGLILVTALCAACGGDAPAEDASFCPRPDGTPHYLEVPPELLPTSRLAAEAREMEIGGKRVAVDRVVEGPLCNDTWRGTVYVTCNVQVYPWEGQPTFLEECNLAIEPGTVVYVADHGDQPYYKGCSCHTGTEE